MYIYICIYIYMYIYIYTYIYTYIYIYTVQEPKTQILNYQGLYITGENPEARSMKWFLLETAKCSASRSLVCMLSQGLGFRV